MSKVFLGLGANIGNKKRNINLAIKLLQEQFSDVEIAPLYESKPVGYKNQNNFLNTAVKATTNLSPLELLNFTKEIEKKVGRIKRFRWGPREIDIDILFYESLIYHDNSLQIPHPRLHERDFVLKPLLELDPNFVHPVFNEPLFKMYRQLAPEEASIIHSQNRRSWDF